MPETFDINDSPATAGKPNVGSQNILSSVTRPEERGAWRARLDDWSRWLFWGTLIVSVLILAYLLYGLLGGPLANPAFDKLDGDAQHQDVLNIGLAFKWLGIFLGISLASLLVCSGRDTGLGYILLGVGVVFYFGLPFLGDQIYGWQNWKASRASDAISGDIRLLTLWFGIPGIIWLIADIVRRYLESHEAAAARRATIKYGVGLTGQDLAAAKHRAAYVLSAYERARRIYMISVGVLLIGVLAIVLLEASALQNVVLTFLGWLNQATKRLSFAVTDASLPHDMGSEAVVWTIIGAAALILATQIIRVIEYFCFRNTPSPATGEPGRHRL